MPSLKRLPRASFTKKLVKICEALDVSSQREVSSRWLGITSHCIAHITRLWVVGSYARGAPLCGDLDLVLEMHSSKGGLAYPEIVAKAFFGILRDVSYFSGTPSENSSGVSFDDAICIWGEPGLNWRTALSSIPINEAAGRQPRERDVIPLEPTQMRSNWDAIDSVVADFKAGRLEWEFHPFDYSAQPPDLAHQPGMVSVEHLAWSMATKNRAIAPHLYALMADQEPNGTWSVLPPSDQSQYRCGGSRVFVGRPPLYADPLGGSAEFSQWVLVPHLSARGPNGAWVIRRGPEHPDVLAARDVKAWYLMDGDSPFFIQDVQDVCGTPHHGPLMLELYRSQGAADEAAGSYNSDDFNLIAKEATGLDLLRLCSQADLLVLDDGTELAHEGVRQGRGGVVGDHITWLGSVADLLRRLRMLASA